MALASAPASATAAAAVAAAAYLDGRYNVRKDLNALFRLVKGQLAFKRASAKNKISLFYCFEEQVARLPQNERCIWSRSGVYTWRETYAMVCRYATMLLSHSIQPKQLVAFYLTNTPEFLFAMVGSWAIGSAPALINYNLAGDALVHCLKLSGSKVLLVDEDSDCQKRIEEVRNRIESELGMTIVILDETEKRNISALSATRPHDTLRDGTVEASDPTMLLYTSGTTGLPKATAFSVERSWITNFSRNVDAATKAGPNGGVWYNPMPMYHGTGCVICQLCLCMGVSLAIGKRFRSSTFWEEVRDSDATAFVYVGETARYLLASPPSPRDKDHKLRLMFGNGLRPDVWNEFTSRFGIETINEFFNSSEGVFTLMNISRGPHTAKAVGHHGGIMRTMLHNKYIPVAVDGEDNSIVRDPDTGFAVRQPYETGGEMLVAIEEEAAFGGYVNASEATQKKFARDVFKKGDLFYRSGDSLRRDVDGRWYFNDRLGDTYRWKSENVSTAEVAIAIGNFPGVVEANVYGVLVPKHDGRAGCAALYIPAEKRDKFDFAGLYAFLNKALPKYAVPVFVRLVVEMRPMHNGKQSKVELRKEGVDPDAIANGHSPRDTVLWSRPGSGTYEPYTRKDWDAINAGQAKL